jgi:hypothetical protein
MREAAGAGGALALWYAPNMRHPKVLAGALVFFCSFLAGAAEPHRPTLDGIRAALHAEIDAQPARGKRGETSKRGEEDQEALAQLDYDEGPGAEELQKGVQQIAAQSGSPKVRRECALFLKQLAAQEERDASEFAGKVDAALHHAGEAVLQAKTASELDPILRELEGLSEQRHYDDEDRASRHSLFNRLSDVRESVQHWQEYVSERESGDAAKAHETLQTLADNYRGSLNIPRSEILARIRALASAEQNEAAARSKAILESIHSLDDIHDAALKFRALPLSRYSSDLVGLMNNLEAIAKAYTGLKQGLATSLTLSTSRPGDSDPVVMHFRSELLLQVLPRLLRLEEKDNPRPGETVEAYLRRVADAARDAGNWDLIDRVLWARKQITLGITDHFSDDTLDDYSALLYFHQGQLQEKAHQYADAVALYRSALRQRGAAIPAAVIGERLDAIKKEHPAEFEEGSKTKHVKPENFPPDHPGAYDRTETLAVPPATPSASPRSSPAPVAP